MSSHNEPQSKGKQPVTADKIWYDVVEVLPLALQGKEADMGKGHYPEFDPRDAARRYPLRTLMNDYRGKDLGPLLPGHVKKMQKPFDSWRQCVLEFNDNMIVKFAHDTPDQRKPFLNFKFGMYSQTPFLAFKIELPALPGGETKPSPNTLVCHIFAQSILAEEDNVGLRFLESTALRDRVKDKGINAENMQKSGSLFCVEVDIREFTNKNFVWRGGALNRLASIIDSPPEPDASMAEKCVYHLYHANKSMTIFLGPNSPQDSEAYQLSKEFILSAFYMAATHGNLWYYQLQTTRSIKSHDFTFADCSVPRWLVKKWKLKIQGTQVIDFDPVEWATLAPGEVYPNDFTYARLLELGLIREFQQAQRNLAHCLTSQPQFDSNEDEAKTKISFEAEFTSHAAFPGQYLVRVIVSGLDNFVTGQLPILRTFVAIELELDNRSYTFEGEVVDDPRDGSNTHSRTDICVLVTGPTGIRDLMRGSHPVRLETRIDLNPSERQMLALRQLLLLDTKTDHGGVFMPNIAIMKPVPEEQDRGTLCRYLHQPDVATRFQQELMRHSLNPEQYATALSLDDANAQGLTLLRGPPGTGKTKTTMATVCALVKAGLKVAVTAGSNAAVLAAFDIYKRMSDADASSRCLFKTAFFQHKPPRKGTFVKTSSDKSPQNDKLSEIFRNVMKLSGRDNTGREDGFLARFEGFVDRYCEEYDDEFHKGESNHNPWKLAKTYYEVNASLSKMPRTHATYSSLCEKWQNLALEINRLVCRDMQVIFCTNSSAGHPVLLEHFEPDVLIIEEAAQASLIDQIVPMAAWMHTIKHVMFAGDPDQRRTVLMSLSCNESSLVLSTSLQERLMRVDQRPNSRKELIMQYRMHPGIAFWPNKEFYKSQLTNGPDVGKQPIDETLIEFLGQYSKELASMRVIAVDVSGPEVSSKKPANSVSSENDAEAEAIVETIQSLLKFVPETPKRRIVAEDLLIITPYGAQRQLIYQKLRKALAKEDAAKMIVSTSNQVQGTEAQIVLVSMTKNDPRKPLNVEWIADKRQLNVNITRAKRQSIVFGNFTAWAHQVRGYDALKDKDKKLKRLNDPLFRSFASFVRFCDKQGTGIVEHRYFLHSITLGKTGRAASIAKGAQNSGPSNVSIKAAKQQQSQSSKVTSSSVAHLLQPPPPSAQKRPAEIEPAQADIKRVCVEGVDEKDQTAKAHEAAVLKLMEEKRAKLARAREQRGEMERRARDQREEMERRAREQREEMERQEKEEEKDLADLEAQLSCVRTSPDEEPEPEDVARGTP